MRCAILFSLGHYKIMIRLKKGNRYVENKFFLILSTTRKNKMQS